MASRTSLQRLRILIGQERGFAVLLPEAERLIELNKRLAWALPTALAGACRVVAVAGGEARIYCDSGAAASRLRSLATSTAKALSSPKLPVERIKVRVQADWSRPVRPAKQGMGAAGLAAWDDLDRTLSPGGLKEAVDHLLLHHRKQS